MKMERDYYFKQAKEKLSKARNTQVEINSRKAEIEQLESIAYGCQSHMDGMPRGSGTSDKVGNLATKIVDLQKEILNYTNKLIDEKRLCLQVINQLDDTRLRSVLIEYYVSGKTWEQIAENMDITEKWAQKLRDVAINKLKYYFKESIVNDKRVPNL